MATLWPWLALAGLGIYHGLNPGMGWLFAVARGLQERSRAVLLSSFAPIALGHLASLAMVVALLALAQPLVDPTALRLASALTLVAFGGYKLIVRRHPRWVGMRVRARELVAWSFLMATAHGAGLMLVPILLRLPADPAHASHLAPLVMTQPDVAQHAGPGHDAPTASPDPQAEGAGLAALAVHTAAMFAAMAGVALLVYERLGLAVLRRAWFNLDLVWSWSLICVGLLSLL